jgi:O-antigen/teichoic acid export membrane protein
VFFAGRSSGKLPQTRRVRRKETESSNCTFLSAVKTAAASGFGASCADHDFALAGTMAYLSELRKTSRIPDGMNVKATKLVPRAGVLLLISNIAEALGPLVRSVALAHLLSPVDFGIAISISAAWTFINLVFDFGLEQSTVRMVDENDGHDVLGTIHTLALFRGTVLALAFGAGGFLIADLVKSGDAASTFTLLSFVFLIQGFSNLGVKRAARNYAFAPQAIVTLVSQIGWTAATLWVATLTRDYRCMLIGLYAASLTGVIASHLLSPIRWRLGWSSSTAREVIRFGAPLVPNGAALAINGLGDRFAVGSLLGPAAVAVYSATMAAAILPRGVVLRFLSTLVLPIFVNQYAEGAIQRWVYDRWTVLLCSVGSAYGLGFLAFGKPLLGIVFGPTYEPDQLFVSIIAVNICQKFLLQLPVASAIAFGDSPFLLFVTALSVGSVVLGIGGLLVAKSLIGFVFAVVIGDCIALAIVIHRSLRKYNFNSSMVWMLSVGSLSILGVAAVAFGTLHDVAFIQRLMLFGTCFTILGAGGFVLWFRNYPLVAKMEHSEQGGQLDP